MAETDYTSMLNLTYELEGLLVLLGQRDDERTDSIRRLAIEKVDLIRRMIAGETPRTVDRPDPELSEIARMPLAPDSGPQQTREDKEPDEAQKSTDDVLPARDSKQSALASSNLGPSTLNSKFSTSIDRPLTLTLNDKFRFRRELFANNDIEFTDTLNVLSAMSNLSEAEDYLYNDLCWDPSNEDVQAFIALLADHFSS